MAEIAAVSARRILGPKDNFLIPFLIAKSSSSEVNPYSGPTNISIDKFDLDANFRLSLKL